MTTSRAETGLCFHRHLRASTTAFNHGRAAMQLLSTALLWLALIQAPAQITDVHKFQRIDALPDRSVRLELGGGVPSIFSSYFDLYLVESSTDLVDWRPSASLLRTNASTNAFTFIDTNAATLPRNFYRIRTNALVTPFLQPSGPFSVGTFARKLTDSSRTNRYNIPTNSSFMVTFWYPAQKIAGKLPALYTDASLANHAIYWIGFTSIVSSFVSHAFPDAPIADGGERYPVIIYTHGLANAFAGVRGENSAAAVELASHGYVVVAIDHIDCFGSVFPDGTRVFREIPFMNVLSSAAEYLASRFQDIQFVLGELRQYAQTDPVLGNRLDLDHVGIMGWSFGGGTSAEACRTNDEIKAAVFLDGFLDPVPAINLGLQKPFLALNAFNSSLAAGAMTLFSKATNVAYILQLLDTGHETFTDQAWITGLSSAARLAGQAQNACAVSFFNKHLKNRDDHLLDNPRVIFPNVSGFQTKALRVVTQPQSRYVIAGANISLSISATSPRPITYQWQFNGTSLPGAVGNTLVLSNVQPSNAGNYNVVLSDSLATLTSQTAILNVGERPVITMQPQSQTATVGSDVTFTVTASGTLPLWFRWRSPPTTITNMMLQTNISVLTIRNVQFNTPSNYNVIVTNLFGSSALSSTAVLTVTNP